MCKRCGYANRNIMQYILYNIVHTVYENTVYMSICMYMLSMYIVFKTIWTIKI